MYIHYDVRKLLDKRVEAHTYKAREAIDEAINDVNEAIAFNRQYKLSVNDNNIVVAYKTYTNTYWLF